jgi:hypothetical protein
MQEEKNRMRMVILIVMAVFAAGGAMAGTLVFSDGTFNNADWSVPSQFGLIFAGQVPTGGHPGSYRENAVESCECLDYIANLNRNFVYNPSAQGAITAITYNIDLITTNAEGAGYFALVEQGGVLYFDADPQSTASATSNSWQNWNLALNLGGFIRLDRKPGSPDFGATGAPLTFGYLVSAGGAGFFESDTGIDNDPITLTTTPIESTAPEPAGFLMTAIGIVILLPLFCGHRRLRHGV